MSIRSERIKAVVEKSKLSYQDLEKLTSVKKSSLQRYVSGVTTKIPLDVIEKLSVAFGVSQEYLMGWDDNKQISNVIPINKERTVPLIGTIACGTPILAEQNVEMQLVLPENVIHADFALRCKGDSMINARILDGDIVYIRQQPDVDNGDIAAVLIDDEATLKRVYKTEGQVTLMAANDAFAPLVYTGERLSEVTIIGKAVGFTSLVK